MSNDHIYWTFSAASQSISAFVAFLLTGYALVHAMLESARERDDSLDEIYSELQKSHHFWLKLLASGTGSAVILSLVVVYLNRKDSNTAVWLQTVVATIDVLSIIGGLWFVISIVDPAKYQKAAKKVLEEIPIAVNVSKSPAADFFTSFLHLERLVREKLRKLDLYVPSRNSQQMSYSFRQMIEALLKNELIDQEFFSELLEINKYRNLIFHGHIDEADSDMLNRLEVAARKFTSLAGDIEGFKA